MHVEVFEKNFCSKQGYWDYLSRKVRLVGLTLMISEMNLVLS